MAHAHKPTDKKAISADAVAREMFPFLIYAAIPIAITLTIAYFLGSTQQIP